MRERQQFGAWEVDPSKLVNLTPTDARDLIIECFLRAQRATFARSRDAMGLESDAEKVRTTITAAVRVVFKEVGGTFERPTRLALEAVVEALARKASAWGTPEDIVEHHKLQAERVLTALS